MLEHHTNIYKKGKNNCEIEADTLWLVEKETSRNLVTGM